MWHVSQDHAPFQCVQMSEPCHSRPSRNDRQLLCLDAFDIGIGPQWLIRNHDVNARQVGSTNQRRASVRVLLRDGDDASKLCAKESAFVPGSNNTWQLALVLLLCLRKKRTPRVALPGPLSRLSGLPCCSSGTKKLCNGDDVDMVWCRCRRLK